MGRRALLAGEKLTYGLQRFGHSPVVLFDKLSGLVGDKQTVLAGDGIAYGEDERQRLDIWIPDAAGDAPLPVIIFFYGGGWTAGERREFGFVGRALAAKGFIAVLPDYRLAPQHRFPDFILDGAAALKWVHDHVAGYGGDPSRIAVAGHSAGGHLAAMLTLNRRFAVEAGLPEGTIKAAALLSAPTNFLPLNDERSFAALGSWPEPMETQPISYARGDAPPIFFAHGTADIVVRCRNSQQLARAIQERGGEVYIHLYRGEVHSDLVKSFSPLFRSSNPVLEDMTGFLSSLFDH